MTRGFDQQDPSANFKIPRTAPSPQHGQKPDTRGAAPKPPRSFEPRPGH